MGLTFLATLKKDASGAFKHVVQVVEDIPADITALEQKAENIIVEVEADVPGLNTIVSKYLEPVGASLLTAAETSAETVAKAIGSGAPLATVEAAVVNGAETIKSDVEGDYSSLISAAGGTSSLLKGIINFAWVAVESKATSIATAALASAGTASPAP